MKLKIWEEEVDRWATPVKKNWVKGTPQLHTYREKEEGERNITGNQGGPGVPRGRKVVQELVNKWGGGNTQQKGKVGRH